MRQVCLHVTFSYSEIASELVQRTDSGMSHYKRNICKTLNLQKRNRSSVVKQLTCTGINMKQLTYHTGVQMIKLTWNRCETTVSERGHTQLCGVDVTVPDEELTTSSHVTRGYVIDFSLPLHHFHVLLVLLPRRLHEWHPRSQS
jgi:hypothetical protein